MEDKQRMPRIPIHLDFLLFFYISVVSMQKFPRRLYPVCKTKPQCFSRSSPWQIDASRRSRALVSQVWCQEFTLSKSWARIGDRWKPSQKLPSTWWMRYLSVTLNPAGFNHTKEWIRISNRCWSAPDGIRSVQICKTNIKSGCLCDPLVWGFIPISNEHSC